MFWANIAADLTRGRPTLGLDYEPPPPIEVLLVGCEDAYSDTVIPRLMASDADLDRVHILEGVRDQKGRLLPFSLAHLDPLAAFLRDHPGVRLVIIDPIAGFIGRAGVKDHHDTEVRTILEPLADLANRCATTILTVKHLNKDEAKTVASRVGGSVAYVNVSRACFVVASDPEDDECRILAPFKWNLNSPKPPSLAFGMEPPPPDLLASILSHCDHLSEDDRKKLASQLHRLNWLGEVEGTADDLIRAAAKGGKRATPNEIERATEWLKQLLAAGPVGSIVAAREGDRFLGRRWPEPGPPTEERRRIVLGRTKWWRENILKNGLGGETKQAGYQGPWLFRMPDHQWPPADDVIDAARRAADGELAATGAAEATEATEAKAQATPGSASVEDIEIDLSFSTGISMESIERLADTVASVDSGASVEIEEGDL
jgi:putative DNA primase/helicase